MSKAAIRALESAGSKGSGSTTTANPGAGKGSGGKGPKPHGRATLGTATF